MKNAKALLAAAKGQAAECTCGELYHKTECEWLREVAERQAAELEIERLGFTPDTLAVAYKLVEALRGLYEQCEVEGDDGPVNEDMTVTAPIEGASVADARQALAAWEALGE